MTSFHFPLLQMSQGQVSGRTKENKTSNVNSCVPTVASDRGRAITN